MKRVDNFAVLTNIYAMVCTSAFLKWLKKKQKPFFFQKHLNLKKSYLVSFNQPHNLWTKLELDVHNRSVEKHAFGYFLLSYHTTDRPLSANDKVYTLLNEEQVNFNNFIIFQLNNT